jgi:hypothetical protein
MPRKPLSEAAKRAFARARKLYWVRKKLDAEEKALKITAPPEATHRTPSYRKTDRPDLVPDAVDPFGEEVFEREMEIPWKREK